jgi:hypothetical protein
MVARVVPMRMPPPINMDMLVAFAHMIAPTHAISGGIVANSLRSRTSESRPTGGDKTDCMRSGPCEMISLPVLKGDRYHSYLDDPTGNSRLPKLTYDEG